MSDYLLSREDWRRMRLHNELSRAQAYVNTLKVHRGMGYYVPQPSLADAQARVDELRRELQELDECSQDNNER